MCNIPEAKPFTALMKGSHEATNDKTPQDIMEESRSEPEPDLSCTCYNSTASRECCARFYLVSHKFGTEISRKLFRPFKGPTGLTGLSYSRLDDECQFRPATATDNRHVAFGRNVYDAIVSGYLYHKKGNECWLDVNGIARNAKDGVWTNHWMTHISLSKPYPRPGNRSLCEYLADESEEDGMRVYTSVIVTLSYAQVLRYWRNVEDRIQQGQNKTLRVCLEDVGDPAKQTDMFQKMMDWLYPGGHNYTIPFRPETYSGGHATSHSETLRNDLLTLVKRLEDDIVNPSLEEIQAVVQCPD